MTRLLNQQFKEAIEDFDKFIRQEDKVADAFICRGLSYLHLKDTVRAYENFNTAIRTNREDPNGYNRRGSLYLEQERYKEAEADFDKAISCDSSYLLSYFNRALVYSSTNRPMKALADFDKVIRLDSTNSLTYFNRAILRSQIGDYNRAPRGLRQGGALFAQQRAGLLQPRQRIRPARPDREGRGRLHLGHRTVPPTSRTPTPTAAGSRCSCVTPRGRARTNRPHNKKIAEYKSRLSDSTYSIYADTTLRFDRLLSFDSKFAGGSFDRITGHNGGREEMRLLPLFKFTLMQPDSVPATQPYRLQRVEDFLRKVGNSRLALSCRASNITPDSLMMFDKQCAEALRNGDTSWIRLFERGVTQALIKQYTNSVNTFSTAIDENPSNPFLYLNRSTTRAEMIDFISSIDNSYQRITIDSDPANRLNTNSKRTYSYDEAVADLNKAIKLFPRLRPRLLQPGKPAGPLGTAPRGV